MKKSLKTHTNICEISRKYYSHSLSDSLNWELNVPGSREQMDNVEIYVDALMASIVNFQDDMETAARTILLPTQITYPNTLPLVVDLLETTRTKYLKRVGVDGIPPKIISSISSMLGESRCGFTCEQLIAHYSEHIKQLYTAALASAWDTAKGMTNYKVGVETNIVYGKVVMLASMLDLSTSGWADDEQQDMFTKPHVDMWRQHFADSYTTHTTAPYGAVDVYKEVTWWLSK